MKIITVAGARPNFMKVKPFLRAISESNGRILRARRRIDSVLVHTGQHYDENMSDVFFRELDIQRPNFNLEVGSGSHAAQTAAIMTAFEAVCVRERPNWVVVVGDVNSTMACTLVCAKMGIRVAHIEAGLRSYDRTMPEEINRLVTDALADLLFAPSADAVENLEREGIKKERIRLVGNIMIDTLLENISKARTHSVLARLGLIPGRIVYVTLHRPSNVDNKDVLSSIISSLEHISQRLPVVFPVHPRTKKMLSDFGLDSSSGSHLHVLGPIGYHESIYLIENSRFVLTDSGGLQEEATFFRVPCLTLRHNTERPITITMGSNKLTSIQTLKADIDRVLDGPERIGQIPPLWDGRTAERILDHLIEASPT